MPRPPKKPRENVPRHSAPEPEQAVGPLRIIGGRMRGRKLQYSGRSDTRPMKERVREAMFNLIGPTLSARHALDLFAGTGAIGLEALSRGAPRATFIEQHIPTAKLIQENIRSLEVEDRCQVISANSLIWVRQPGKLPTEPWVVFISPPWEMFKEQAPAMLELITRLKEQAPPGSMLVVEADMDFDMTSLPASEDWRVRAYPPAVIGIWENPLPAGSA